MGGDLAFKGTEIIGYDEEGGYFTRLFDNVGNHPEYRLTANDDVWTFTESATRATVTVRGGGNQMTVKWEWRIGGSDWLPLCDRMATRLGELRATGSA